MAERIGTYALRVEIIRMQGKWGLISTVAHRRELSILFSGGQTLIYVGAFNDEVVLY